MVYRPQMILNIHTLLVSQKRDNLIKDTQMV